MNDMQPERASYATPGPYEPPTPDEFRALLSRWELSGAAAGDLVDVKGRQIRRYTGGQTPVPYAVLFTLATKLEDVRVSTDRWRAELRLGGIEAVDLPRDDEQRGGIARVADDED